MSTTPAAPKFPVFVPSKARAKCAGTFARLVESDVPFTVVVEPSDETAYRWALAGKPGVAFAVLDRNDAGICYVRQWMLDRVRADGAEAYWQIDDNVSRFARRRPGTYKHDPLPAGAVLTEAEESWGPSVGLLCLPYFRESGLAWHSGVHYVPEDNRRAAMAVVLTRTALPCDYDPTVPSKEDIDFSLQCIRSGFSVRTDWRLAVDKRTMAAGGGGLEKFYATGHHWPVIDRMAMKWPCVRVVQKRTHGKDIAVDWRKAQAVANV